MVVLLTCTLGLVSLAGQQVEASGALLQAEEARTLGLTRLSLTALEVARLERFDLIPQGYSWNAASLTSLCLELPWGGMGGAQVDLGPGNQGWAWEPLSGSLVWGFLNQKLGPVEVGVGLAGSGAWDLVLQPPKLSQIVLRAPSASAWFASVARQPFLLTAGQAFWNPTVQYQNANEIGAAQVRADFVSLGGPSQGFLYAQAEASLQAFFHVLNLVPLASKGEFQARLVAAWWDAHTDLGPWRFGLLSSGALAWAPKGTLQTYQEWWSFLPAFPFLETLHQEVQYTLAWNPAWVLVLKPRVTWSVGSFSVELSRWLPLAGGWDIQSTATQSAEASGQKNTPSWQTLCVEGVEVTGRYRY